MLTMHSKTRKRFTINLFTILAALAVLALAAPRVVWAHPCDRDPSPSHKHCGDGPGDPGGNEITPATITFDDVSGNEIESDIGPYIHVDPEDVDLDVFIGSAANDGNIILRDLRDGITGRQLHITFPAADECGLTSGLIDLELLKVDADDVVSGGIYGIAEGDPQDVPMRIRFAVGANLYFLNFDSGKQGPCKNRSGLVTVSRDGASSWTVQNAGNACLELHQSQGRNDLCFGQQLMSFSFTIVEGN